MRTIPCFAIQSEAMYSTCFDMMRESSNSSLLQQLLSQFFNSRCMHTSTDLLSSTFIQTLLLPTTSPLFETDFSHPTLLKYPISDRDIRLFVQFNEGQWAITSYRHSRLAFSSSSVSFKCFLCDSTRFCSHHCESCRKLALDDFTSPVTLHPNHRGSSSSSSTSARYSSSSEPGDGDLYDELMMFSSKAHSTKPFTVYNPSQLQIIYDRKAWVDSQIWQDQGQGDASARCLNFQEGMRILDLLINLNIITDWLACWNGLLVGLACIFFSFIKWCCLNIVDFRKCFFYFRCWATRL